MALSLSDLEQLVHEALTHYADSARLQASPLLVHLTAANLPLDERVGELREMLRQALQTLRPPSDVPYGEREWLFYRILWSRFIQRRSQIAICDELALSRATYYRYQSEAIRSVAHYLLMQGKNNIGRKEKSGQAKERAIEEAARLAYSAKRDQVDLYALMDEVMRIVGPLLIDVGVELLADIPPSFPAVYGDPAVLRQIAVNILSGAFKLRHSDVLALTVTVEQNRVVWCVRGMGGGEEPLEWLIGRRLLQVYGGTFTRSAASTGHAVCFSLPISSPTTILIVEDEEDTIQLFQRFLVGSCYSARVARGGAEMWDMLELEKIDLILLDVLMPREDGWLILQRLQTSPELAQVPVVVCSVLEQPSLAMSLGARQVLNKPVDRQALLGAIEATLASNADSRSQ